MMEPYFDTLEKTARDTIILWMEYVNCIDFWLEENVEITMLWKFWMQCFVRVEIDIEHEHELPDITGHSKKVYRDLDRVEKCGFLDATTHLYKRSCPSIRRFVRPVLFSNDEYGHFLG